MLKTNFKQVDTRKNIEFTRNSAIEKYFKELSKAYDDGKLILSNKPWVENHYNKTFLKEIRDLEKWFNENYEKQSKLKLYDVK